MADLLEASDAIANGYNAGHVWCRRCDVGWNDTWLKFERTCWLCGKDDEVWRWGWVNVHPVFQPVKS